MLQFLKLTKASKDSIKKDLTEQRPLPLGRKEFEEWSDRIIKGALVPADPESIKYTLANVLMHLPPTQDHEADIYFIKTLRKYAINQVADTIRRELYEKRKAQDPTTPKNEVKSENLSNGETDKVLPN